MASNDELRAHLAVVAEHVQEALALIGTGGGGLVMPPGSTACAHPQEKRTYTMGGHWTCPCGAEGREE